MPVLDRRAANRSSDALSIAVLGCSTGEESVRIFWELSTELAQRGNKPGIKICGVDLEKRVVTEARRRVSGAKPLQGSMNNDDSEYARDIINGINHDLSLKSALRESVEFREGDITKPDTLKEAIEKQPDIIFINHTFRLFDQGAQLKIYGALSATFRDAVIAIGDPEGVINNLVQEGGYEHLLVRPEIREGLTVYAFGLPFWTNQVIPGLWG
jgi:chemotaxis methyl-accepting protein methylase